MNTSTQPSTGAAPSVERRTIDHIPHDERHGRARDIVVGLGAAP